MGHCLASNRSGDTRNILLHWMHTRWMTGLMTAPGWIGLCRPPDEGEAVFSGGLSPHIGGFWHAEVLRPHLVELAPAGAKDAYFLDERGSVPGAGVQPPRAPI